MARVTLESRNAQALSGPTFPSARVYSFFHACPRRPFSHSFSLTHYPPVHYRRLIHTPSLPCPFSGSIHNTGSSEDCAFHPLHSPRGLRPLLPFDAPTRSLYSVHYRQFVHAPSLYDPLQSSEPRAFHYLVLQSIINYRRLPHVTHPHPTLISLANANPPLHPLPIPHPLISLAVAKPSFLHLAASPEDASLN